jgi:hypothetical protein
VPREGDVVGSHELEETPAPKPHVGSRPSEDTTGPYDQEASGSYLLEALSGPEGNRLLEPNPLEVDVPDPPGRVWTIQGPVYYISEVIHDA